MNYSDLKVIARKIAQNECLLNWSNNSNEYSYTQYNVLVNNLRHWLGPTAYRLDLGCNILKEKNEQDNNLDDNILKIIEAFELNIAEEKGLDDGKSHAYLFTKSINSYSQVVYKKELKYGKGLQTTMILKDESEKLFNSDLYIMLGAALAQEIHALPQLELLVKGAEQNKSLFSDEKWVDVSYFYDIHLDGTEARHAEDLNRTIWSIIDTDSKKEKFMIGFNKFLELLDEFWSSLYLEVKNAKY